MVKNKEELIGTKWACPKCGEEVEITEKGLAHRCNVDGIYYADMSLSTYFSYKKAYEDFAKDLERKLLYDE